MAVLAMPGIFGRISPVVNMGVVTSGAVHIAHPETFAAGQQLCLVAVYIQLREVETRQHKMAQRIAW